jgi:hypothetical protein
LIWRPTDKSPEGYLGFDCVESETYTSTSSITTHPVEVGANVADHIREEPDKVSLTVFISNSPTHGDNLVDPNSPRGEVSSLALDVPEFKPSLFGLSNLISAGIGALKSALFGKPPVPRAQVLQFKQPFNAVLETWESLKQRKAEGRLIEVITRDWSVDSMVITTITEPRTNAEGDGARMTIELQKIRIVETRNVTAPIPAEVRGKSIAGAGSQGSKTADAAKKSSFLKQGADWSGVSKGLGLP